MILCVFGIDGYLLNPNLTVKSLWVSHLLTISLTIIALYLWFPKVLPQITACFVMAAWMAVAGYLWANTEGLKVAAGSAFMICLITGILLIKASPRFMGITQAKYEELIGNQAHFALEKQFLVRISCLILENLQRRPDYDDQKPVFTKVAPLFDKTGATVYFEWCGERHCLEIPLHQLLKDN